jgi:LemA protein
MNSGDAMQISPGLVAMVILVGLVMWLVAAFNKLVVQRTRVQNAWAEIDVQLKRRHDLIPNLVEAVRGYMQHERATLESVTQARAQAMAAGRNTQERIGAESLLTAVLGKLIAVVENYPQLRAVESVQLLQEQLTSTENRIAYARQFYNDEVMNYNAAQATFPRNLFAGLLGFSPSVMFAAADGERAHVQVKV